MIATSFPYSFAVVLVVIVAVGAVILVCYGIWRLIQFFIFLIDRPDKRLSIAAKPKIFKTEGGTVEKLVSEEDEEEEREWQAIAAQQSNDAKQ